MTARGIDFTGIAYLLGIGAVLYAVYRLAKAGPIAAANVGAAVTQALNAINPASADNVAYQAVNSAVQAATGDQNATLGTKAFEFFNPGTMKLESQITSSAPSVQSESWAGALQRAFDTAAWPDTGTSAADAEDADLGAAVTQLGAAVPMQVTPNFSYLTRAGLNF